MVHYRQLWRGRRRSTNYQSATSRSEPLTGTDLSAYSQTHLNKVARQLSIGPIGPLADIARSLPLDEECHRNAWQVPFRVRHQKEAIDGVVLNASQWKGAEHSSLLHGDMGLFDRALNTCVRLGKAGSQMFLVVRLGCAIAKL